MTWLICLVWKVIKCAKFCTFTGFIYTFKCILNYFGCMFCLGIGSILFSKYNFSNQFNSICIWLSIFSCIFWSDWLSLVFKKGSLLKSLIPHGRWMICLYVGGHSITTWTRWGGKKMAKFCPRSCWMTPYADWIY